MKHTIFVNVFYFIWWNFYGLLKKSVEKFKNLFQKIGFKMHIIDFSSLFLLPPSLLSEDAENIKICQKLFCWKVSLCNCHIEGGQKSAINTDFYCCLNSLFLQNFRVQFFQLGIKQKLHAWRWVLDCKTAEFVPGIAILIDRNYKKCLFLIKSRSWKISSVRSF